MTDKNAENLIKNMLRQMNGRGGQSLLTAAPQQDPVQEVLGPLFNAIQQIEAAITHLIQGQHTMGSFIDMNRLTLSAMVRLMIKNDMFTEDEWKEIYQTEVVDKMNKIKEEMEAQIKQHLAEEMKESGAELKEVATPDDINDNNLSEVDSDVVLPSERSDRVVKFPSKPKE